MQQADRHGLAGLEDSIIEACTFCMPYDPECEAQRAPWLFSIVDRAKLNSSVLQAVKAILQKMPPENLHDMHQRAALLKEFAASGSDDAKRLLYSTLAHVSETPTVIGADQIVALDGENGLLYVARQIGRWMAADPHFPVDDYLISLFDESEGAGRGFAALAREAVVDADIAVYLSCLRKTAASGSAVASHRVDATAYSGAQIVAHVKTNPTSKCHWFRHWGAHADSNQYETVFAALLASNDPEQAKRLFRCFEKNGVPRFDKELLRWVADPDEEVRWLAVKALAPVTHAEIRHSAKQLLADGDVANGIALLVNNFDENDFSLCIAHLDRVDKVSEVHDLVGALLELCQAHPGGEALDCLLYVYEYSPCSICRKRAVQQMIAAIIVPAWVLTECALDADPGIRELSPECIVTGR